MTSHDFEFDSAEYELLAKGIELSKDVEGLCVEIGLRLGRGTATIMEAIAEYCPAKRTITIDPYGSLLYAGREGQLCRLDYTDGMRNACLPKIYTFAEQLQVKFKHIELTDTDFFDKCADGVIIYDHERYVINEYSFVHFDGPHNIKDLQTEFDFFYPRMNIGAILCFDDITIDFFDVSLLIKHMGDKVEQVYLGAKKGLWRKIK